MSRLSVETVTSTSSLLYFFLWLNNYLSLFDESVSIGCFIAWSDIAVGIVYCLFLEVYLRVNVFIDIIFDLAVILYLT